ncbi:YhgE/Pip family protein [Thermaerobacillus caldiproteolyticus]|uniref:YhgE/Pip family protein n=1 Tax=Thermaerobacillus caldiproteolyticus TaxID=247480 RepID=UPI001E4A3CBD|nr:YhgE/Pip family protein [Anoxybacillus caldiproteolyticus]
MVQRPKRLIVLIGILFIPILYSGTYLWAFWDPYGHLERLPVAVVNEDRPATYKGTTYAIGDELVDELKKIKVLSGILLTESKQKKDCKIMNFILRYSFRATFPSVRQC